MLFTTLIFPILFIPLVYLLVTFHFFDRNYRERRFLNLFYSGLGAFVVVEILYQIIHLTYKIDYEWLPLYFYLWSTEVIPFLIVLIAGYFLLIKKGYLRYDSYSEYPYIFSFTAGVLFFSGLFRFVNSLMKFDFYMLFLFPLVLLSILIIFPLIVVEAGVRRGYLKILFFITLLPLSFLLTLVSWFYYVNNYAAAVVSALVITAGVLSAFWVLKKDYIKQ